jgi:hypothetical protein
VHPGDEEEKGMRRAGEKQYFVTLNVATRWTILLLVEMRLKEGKVLGSGVNGQRKECERENSSKY